MLKFADGTTVIGLISDNDASAYREEVQHLSAWCADKDLGLKVANSTPSTSTDIGGVDEG